MEIRIKLEHDTSTNTMTLTAQDDCHHEVVLECLSERDVGNITIRELKNLLMSESL